LTVARDSPARLASWAWVSPNATTDFAQVHDVVRRKPEIEIESKICYIFFGPRHRRHAHGALCAHDPLQPAAPDCRGTASISACRHLQLHFFFPVFAADAW
jgi:hypothetical protein